MYISKFVRLLNAEAIYDHLASFVARPKSNRKINDAMLLIKESINSKLEANDSAAGSYLLRFQLKKEKVAEELGLTDRQLKHATQFLRETGILTGADRLKTEFGWQHFWKIDFRELDEAFVSFFKIDYSGNDKIMSLIASDSVELSFDSMVTYSVSLAVKNEKPDYQLYDLQETIIDLLNDDAVENDCEMLILLEQAVEARLIELKR